MISRRELDELLKMSDEDDYSFAGEESSSDNSSDVEEPAEAPAEASEAPAEATTKKGGNDDDGETADLVDELVGKAIGVTPTTSLALTNEGQTSSTSNNTSSTESKPAIAAPKKNLKAPQGTSLEDLQANPAVAVHLQHLRSAATATKLQRKNSLHGFDYESIQADNGTIAEGAPASASANYPSKNSSKTNLLATSGPNPTTTTTETPSSTMKKTAAATKTANYDDLFGDEDQELYEESFHDEDPHNINATGDPQQANANDPASAFDEENLECIRISKRLFYLVLLSTIVIVLTVTYKSLAEQQHDDYQIALDHYADLILSGIATQVDTDTRGLLQNWAVSITSFAAGTNMNWPNVTIGDFVQRATQSRSSATTGTDLIAFAPIVPSQDVHAWNAYVDTIQDWTTFGIALQGLKPLQEPKEQQQEQAVVPLWQIGPLEPGVSIVSQDLYNIPWFRTLATQARNERRVMLSGVEDINKLFPTSNLQYIELDPRSLGLLPVTASFQGDSMVVGYVMSVLSWKKVLKRHLPPEDEGVRGLVVHLDDSCGSVVTYQLDGPNDLLPLPNSQVWSNKKTDHVLRLYDYSREEDENGDETEAGESPNKECTFQVSVHATSAFRDDYDSNEAVVKTVIFAVLLFLLWICFVQFELVVWMKLFELAVRARRSTAIVSSLFPKAVGEKLIEEADDDLSQAAKSLISNRSAIAKQKSSKQPKDKIRKYFDHESGEKGGKRTMRSKPIADLFPSATILFADIVGFTAWSSAREPTQVFTLLETIYHEFDMVAKRRRVFKVETVGDCYVAVCGLPDPREDHAVVMAQFARECLKRIVKLLEKLERLLGPDTADLGFRFGLHSGPVTAGVLRGDRARFQLFGDTVNTTSRIETTGMKNKIHISQECADHIILAGKGHWLKQREEKVYAKGKGEMTTYWLLTRAEMQRKSIDSTDISVSTSGLLSESMDGSDELTLGTMPDDLPEVKKVLSDKYQRLIDWNTELLVNSLRHIAAQRRALKTEPDSPETLSYLERSITQSKISVLDEVDDMITLPNFSPETAVAEKDTSSIEISKTVVTQLREYIESIAKEYRDHPFHNFEHASHVTMSAVKLLSRVVAPNLMESNEQDMARDLHDHTYGIASDPLTHFTVVLSALVHDVDHPGLSNGQLKEQDPRLCEMYQDKSIAEQRSIEIAWELLMEDSYEELRRAIYITGTELRRFRQLLVNIVMATDVMDKQVNLERKMRWNKAFADDSTEKAMTSNVQNRRATIVLEHLIQASDVAHTMQHWEIYRKWNRRLFEEMYQAYLEGKAAKDPADFWYQGELNFFDFYVLPLATKLRSCGVFGVSSDEYLEYARQNRQDWEQQGREVVAEIIADRESESYEVDDDDEDDDDDDDEAEDEVQDEDDEVNQTGEVAFPMDNNNAGGGILDRSGEILFSLSSDDEALPGGRPTGISFPAAASE